MSNRNSFMPYYIPSDYHFSHKVSYAITIYKPMKQLVWLKLACTLSTSWTPMDAWIIGELPPCFLAAVSNGSGVRSCLPFTYSHSFPKDQTGILSRFCPPLRSQTLKESTSQFPMLVLMWQNINLPIFRVKYIFMLGLLYIYVNTFL